MLVIVFGRFGQIVSQVLLARHTDVTLLDGSAERIRQASRFGFRVYFGDGTRRDVLRAAGAERASIICVCVARREVANRIVELVTSEFPNARVFARSFDRGHTLELLTKGVDFEIRETFESAIVLGGETLRALGIAADEVAEVIAEVRRRDSDRLAEQLIGETMERPMQPEPLTVPARRSDQRPAAQ